MVKFGKGSIEVFLNLLTQACGSWDDDRDCYLFDAMCIGAYEDAIELALELGLISKDQVIR